MPCASAFYTHKITDDQYGKSGLTFGFGSCYQKSFYHKTNKSNGDFQINKQKLNMEIKVVERKLALVPYCW